MPALSEAYFRFADLAFSMRTNHPLKDSDNFLPFMSDDGEADFRLVLEPADSLEDCDGTVICEDITFTVIRRPDGELIRVFKDPRNGDFPYAIGRCSSEEGVSRVLYLQEYSGFFFNLSNCFYYCSWEKLILWQNRLILHAACVQTQFGGILFSGPSGIGKSTQAGLWESYEGARQINGDRPIMYKDEIGWLAAGSPYAGSSLIYIPESVPVRAIVMLQQGNACSLHRLNVRQAFKKLYSCSMVYSWDEAYVERVLNLVQGLAMEVPVYELVCTPDTSAVEILKKELMEAGG